MYTGTYHGRKIEFSNAMPFPFISCFSLQRRHYRFSNWLIEPITAYCAVPSLPPDRFPAQKVRNLCTFMMVVQIP